MRQGQLSKEGGESGRLYYLRVLALLFEDFATYLRNDLVLEARHPVQEEFVICHNQLFNVLAAITLVLILCVNGVQDVFDCCEHQQVQTTRNYVILINRGCLISNDHGFSKRPLIFVSLRLRVIVITILSS